MVQIKFTPIRPWKDFFPGAERFAIPDFHNLPKWNNRMICNLLYYQTNYILMAVVVFLIVGQENLPSWKNLERGRVVLWRRNTAEPERWPCHIIQLSVVHQPLHEREDREEDCVPLHCSSYHLRAEEKAKRKTSRDGHYSVEQRIRKASNSANGTKGTHPAQKTAAGIECL